MRRSETCMRPLGWFKVESPSHSPAAFSYLMGLYKMVSISALSWKIFRSYFNIFGRIPPITVHRDLLNQYIISMLMREVFRPADQHSLVGILLTRYPNGPTTVLKSGNIHLDWNFMQNPAHHRFTKRLTQSKK